MARSVTDIQTDLTAFYAARQAIASGQSYSLDTGQGRVTMTRANLTEINRTITDLEAELDEANGGGVSFITLERGV